MGAGKIIGGIFLILLGVIFYGVSDWGNTKTSYDMERCNSLLGELGQGLNEDTYEYCQSMSVGNSISNVGIVVAIIFFLIGLTLIIIGAIGGKQDKKKVKEIKDSNINVNSTKKSEGIRDEKIVTQSPTSIHNTDDPIIENKDNNNNDYLSRLEKLAEMKKNGILTQEEFNILKVEIIKKFGSASIEITTKSDLKVTNSNSLQSSKNPEQQKKIKKYTSDGKPIYE